MRNGGFYPAAELRELGEQRDREIVGTVWFMICTASAANGISRAVDYAE